MNKWIHTDHIRTQGGTQTRLKHDEDLIQEYTAALREDGNVFKDAPIVVFGSGQEFWIADGFHRFYAYRNLALQKVYCDVRVGDRRDALRFALSANATHGRNRTNADKRKCVEMALADEEWGTWSDRKIAELCAVSQPFVSSFRKQPRQQLESDNDYQIPPESMGASNLASAVHEVAKECSVSEVPTEEAAAPSTRRREIDDALSAQADAAAVISDPGDDWEEVTDSSGDESCDEPDAYSSQNVVDAYMASTDKHVALVALVNCLDDSERELLMSLLKE